MSPVRRSVGAIPTVEVAIVGITPAARANIGVVFLPWIADAVRPGVIADDGQAAHRATFDGKQQAVVAGSSTAIDSIHKAVISADLYVFQTEPAALIGIGRGRARIVCHAVERAWTAG